MSSNRPDQSVLESYAVQARHGQRSWHQQAKAFVEANKHLADVDIDTTLATGFECSGMITVASLFFFKIDVTLTCNDTELEFTGSGGMLGAGSGTAWGSASFSIPFDQIAGNVSYEAHFSPVYIGVNWFRNNVRIGTFNAGGIGVIAGVGGGTGDFFFPK